MTRPRPTELPATPLALDAVIPWLDQGAPHVRMRRARVLLEHRPDLVQSQGPALGQARTA